MAEFELKALITGVDRLSPALSKMQKKIRGFKRQAEEASQGGLALGGGLAAGLTLSLKSYADQENAATGLKVAMMDANGEVGKSFQDINKLAIGLGNQLPGTTADFQNMMQMLVRQGIPAENILGGVGKATAYLAVQLKKTPEAAAEFAAKMQDATGTASEDMMGLFDTIQKAFYSGKTSFPVIRRRVSGSGFLFTRWRGSVPETTMISVRPPPPRCGPAQRTHLLPVTVRCISGRQGRLRGQAVLPVRTLKPGNGRRGRMKPPMWCRAGDRVTVRCGSPTSG